MGTLILIIIGFVQLAALAGILVQLHELGAAMRDDEPPGIA